MIIRTPCNQGIMKKIKMISERRWNPKGKWEVPYSEDSIAKLQFFGENPVVDPYFYPIPLQMELSIRKYSRRTINPLDSFLKGGET